MMAWRCRSGDRASFEELYRATCGRIYAIALRMSANPSVAEDITQETYVRVWQSIASFRGDSAFTSWLTAIAIRVSIDHFRRDSRYEAATGREGSASTSIDHRIDLDRAIATLPPSSRHVLVLYDILGYRHAEIAEQLGITVGSSKWHLHNARKLMIKELQHERRTE
jgi:RNA polymerase sigma-70 factor (ECF subfamily)